MTTRNHAPSSDIALHELQALESERLAAERELASQRAAAELRARDEQAARERVADELRARAATEAHELARAREAQAHEDEARRLAALEAELRAAQDAHLHSVRRRIDAEFAGSTRRRLGSGLAALAAVVLTGVGVGVFVLTPRVDATPSVAGSSQTDELAALAAEAAALRDGVDRLRHDQSVRDDLLARVQARQAASAVEEAPAPARTVSAQRSPRPRPRQDKEPTTKTPRVKLCASDDPLAGINDDC